jgi:glycine/D-amino acid oxidase-like deaminating enzyme
VVTGAEPVGARLDGTCAVIVTPVGRFEADHVIACTGVDIDYAARPELARFAGNIATWADRYTPPAAERNDRLARFPYLSRDFAFEERKPGRTPWIGDIHLFSIASTMSFGPSGSSINAMTTVIPKVVSGVTRGLFKGDLDAHWAALEAYDVPQAILRRPV